MIEAPASKSFAVREAPTQKNRISPFVWMNLVCLDAPLVAVSWHWLFARSFHVPIPAGATAALFLTAWLIYLADRLVDSLSLDPAAPTSARQAFCLRHRTIWLVALPIIALADLVVVWNALDAVAVLVGCVVGLCAFVYLMINQLRPTLWSVLPLKEISIGFIFAAGTMVGLLRNLPISALPAWICFACLCSLNCISIAIWERGLDQTQRRVSIATAFPSVERWLLAALGLLAVMTLASGHSVLHLCIAMSAALLAAVHLFRDSVHPDIRTALADLVLLTPLVALAI